MGLLSRFGSDGAMSWCPVVAYNRMVFAVLQQFAVARLQAAWMLHFAVVSSFCRWLFMRTLFLSAAHCCVCGVWLAVAAVMAADRFVA
jgi:hypothetical protein